MKLPRKNSLIFRLFTGVLAFMIPVSSLLFAYALYSRHAVLKQAYSNYTDYAGLISGQIDHQLSDLESYLTGIHYVDDNIAHMRRTTDPNARYLDACTVNSLTESYLRIHTAPMLFFITCEGLRIPAVSTFTTGQSSIEMSALIRQLRDGEHDYSSMEFIPVQLGDAWYLLEYFEKDGVSLGIIIDLTSMITLSDFQDSAITAVYFRDLSGQPLTNVSAQTPTDNTGGAQGDSGTVGRKQAMVIHAPLSMAPVELTIEIPSDQVTGKLALLFPFALLLLAASVASLFAYLFYIRRQIAGPLHHLEDTIRRIEKNGLEHRVEFSGATDEIAGVYCTFNSFVEHISRLKMQTYEEKLSRQQTELQYLRLQLRPHFFLNSLKSIFALAQRGDFALIQDYVLCLSSHYRFLLYDTSDLIPLQDELKHTQNYVQLQRIGYNLPIECQVSISCAPDLVLVPTLVLQTFVENSIKYAVIPGQTLKITLSAQLNRSDDIFGLNFTIQDNGPGFSEDILTEMQEDESGFFEQHKGFGNLKRRLALIYTEETFIYMYNHPDGGAVVDILLPCLAKEEQG